MCWSSRTACDSPRIRNGRCIVCKPPCSESRGRRRRGCWLLSSDCALFAAGAATETTVRAAVTDAERTRAELRVIHLLAHLETRALLSAEQIRQYHAARWQE
jgi:hypothetical protein